MVITPNPKMRTMKYFNHFVSQYLFFQFLVPPWVPVASLNLMPYLPPMNLLHPTMICSLHTFRLIQNW